MQTTNDHPWSPRKWLPKKQDQLEARLQTLDLILKILVPSILLTCLVLAIKFGSFNGYLQLMSRQSFATPLMTLGAGFTLAYLAFQMVRTVLWWRYKPYPLWAGPLPRVTVIVPAYNEGAMVEKALYSAAASDYPADLLEIICIDDGSKDDTWSYIERAQQRHPELIKAIRFPKNQGKKEGLYTGFTQGKGDFFVTIDSDSVICPDTIKQVIAPMLQDPKIGAVAGNVKVYNRFRVSWAACWPCASSWPSISSGPPNPCTAGSPAPPAPCPRTGARALTPILEKWRQADLPGLPRQYRRRPGLDQLRHAPGFL